MRAINILTIVGFLLAATTAGAAPISSVGHSRVENDSAIQLVQAKKEETVTQKVKRAWRKFTAYKFDVACPSFALALTRSTCTVNAKNRAAARTKCQQEYPLCQIGNAK